MPPERPVPDRPAIGQPKRDANQRAQAVKAALADRGPGRFTVHTPAGSVAFERVEVVTIDGVDVIEIVAGDPENQDPHFRVINPPIYVPDPDGDIERVTLDRDGNAVAVIRLRDDPIAALAHVIAQHGGRIKDPRRGRQ